MGDDCVGRGLMALYCWVKDWQTGLTGLGAIVAAVFAVRATRRQINQVEDHRQRDRAGRLRAARASLPITLSAICEFAKESSLALHAGWPKAASVQEDDGHLFRNYPVSIKMPVFPSELISSLERNIECAEDQAVSERLASIVREIQILSARSSRFSDPAGVEMVYLAGMVEQTASIYARAETLFLYSRGQTATVSARPLWDRVMVALGIMKVQKLLVFELAEEKRQRGDPPGFSDNVEPD